MGWKWFAEKKPVAPETLNFMLSVTDRFIDGNWLQFGFKKNNEESMRPVMLRNNFFSHSMEKTIYKNSNRSTHSFFCPQAFSYGKRNGGTLFALQNIVIDVDCHSTRISKTMRNQKLNALKYRLENDAFSEYDLPLPNYFVFTGRGLQIWWRHESMAAFACKNTWLSIVKCFIEIIKKIITENSGPDVDDLENLEGLEVDEGASLNTVGFFRIPGTFNPKAKEYSYLVECMGAETVYSYQELRQFRDDYRAETPIKPKKPAVKKPYQVPGHEYSASVWAGSTAEKIEKLRDLRDGDIGNETRNNFCVALYCLYRASDLTKDEAMKRLHIFNDGFKKPMTENELKSTLASAWRKDYQYSTLALAQLLDISREEADEIGLKFTANPKEEAKRKKDAIKERNEKIVHLYTTSNKTQQEVANEVGVSRKVVGTVLRENSISRASRNAKKIQKLNKKGKSVEQISENVGCSNRTVYRALQNTAGKNVEGAPEAAQTEMTNPETATINSEDKNVNAVICAAVTAEAQMDAESASEKALCSVAGKEEATGEEQIVEGQADVIEEQVGCVNENTSERPSNAAVGSCANSRYESFCDKMYLKPPNNGYLKRKQWVRGGAACHHWDISHP